MANPEPAHPPATTAIHTELKDSIRRAPLKLTFGIPASPAVNPGWHPWPRAPTPAKPAKNQNQKSRCPGIFGIPMSGIPKAAFHKACPMKHSKVTRVPPGGIFW